GTGAGTGTGVGVGVVVVDVPVVDPGAPEFTTVVVTEPSALVLVALADVRLPAASIAYCAAPLPAPQAASRTETLVMVAIDAARINFLLLETFNIKALSLRFYDLIKHRSLAITWSKSLVNGN
ncbi:MAG: hypothetical protein WBJ21_05230, partial [Burkholderiaceae bacterium]